MKTGKEGSDGSGPGVLGRGVVSRQTGRQLKPGLARCKGPGSHHGKEKPKGKDVMEKRA